MKQRKVAQRTVVLSVISSTFLALIKGVTGILGNSHALVADAIESTTDVFSSLLLLLGLRYATKPADDNHPYGHGRIEPLLTFAIVGFLVVAATVIVYKSILQIQHPHATPEFYTLYVLGGVILFKELSYRYVRKRGDELHSSSLKAEAWHHRSDAITSLLALIGISVAIYMGPGYESADDWAAILASGFILYNAYLIFRPALGELLDEHVYDALVDEIRTLAATVPGVENTEKCFVRKVGMNYLVDLHLEVDGEKSVREGHSIAHRLKEEIISKIPEVSDVLVHVEPAAPKA